MQYASSAALDSYITSASYALTPANPKIIAAIEFTAVPSGGVGNWAYSLRLQRNQANARICWLHSRHVSIRIIHHQQEFRHVSGRKQALNGVINLLCFHRSTMTVALQGGFITLQTLVDKFIFCNPDPATLASGVVSCLNANSKVLPKILQRIDSPNAAYDSLGYFIPDNTSRTFDSAYFGPLMSSELNGVVLNVNNYASIAAMRYLLHGNYRSTVPSTSTSIELLLLSPQWLHIEYI